MAQRFEVRAIVSFNPLHLFFFCGYVQQEPLSVQIFIKSPALGLWTRVGVSRNASM